jgi:hypothetical protein
MNYCRRCECDFEQPGTCNCYAQVQRYYPYPYLPFPYTSPFWIIPPYQVQPYQPWCGGSIQGNDDIGKITVTYTPNDGSSNVALVSGAPSGYISGNSVSIKAFAGVPFSYTEVRMINEM